MKDFLNKFYRNHSLIYKGLLLVCTTFLIVYLFPKSGKFKYNFEKGKPWQSENLYAPFDFAIKKSDAEIAKEKETISENALVYFNLESLIYNEVDNLFDSQFPKVFKDTIPKKDFEALYIVGKQTINDLYRYGILEENHSFKDDKSVVILSGRKTIQKTLFSSLVGLEQISTRISN